MDDDQTHDQSGPGVSGEQQNNLPNEKQNHRRRGPSKGLKQKAGVIKILEWDELGRPVGKWSKKFATHIGTTTRSKVSILIDEWANVPQGLKETIWLDIKKEFQIDDKYKAKVLKKCCAAWTGHKAKLVSGWIECSRPMPQNKREPYENDYYQHITKEVWEEFVKIHSTEEAKIKREKARKSQSHNLHPHRLGQNSYAEKTVIWRDRGLLPTPSPSATSSSDISSVVSLASNRAITWLLARSKLDEKGNTYIPNERTREVKDKIDEWTKKQEQGEFIPGRLDDVLNRSLGKRDRHGRPVLGIGSGVTVKESFGNVDRNVIRGSVLFEIERRVSQKVRQELREEVRQELREELRDELRDELREELRDELTSSMNALLEERFVMLAKQMKLPDQVLNVETNSPLTPRSNVPSSCQSGGLNNSLASQEVNDPKEPQSCRLALFLHDPKQRVIVANGLWYPQMRVDHNKPISPENVRVSVDQYEKQYGDVPVPVPSERIKKLHQAHGSFVQWPKVLVDLSTNEVITNENNAIRKEVANGAKMKEVASGAQIKEVASGAQMKEVVGTSKSKKSLSGSKKALSGHDTKGSFTNPKKVFCCDKEYQHLSNKCRIMQASLSAYESGQVITIVYNKNTFLCNKDCISLTTEDVMEFLAGDWIGVSVVQVFLMALLNDNANFHSFGFMCPDMISETMISSSMDESTTYMTKVMQEHNNKRFILCPYYQDNHWILLVVCTSRSEVYVFDSMRPSQIKQRVLSIRIPLCNAFRSYRYQAGNSTKVQLTWTDANCAQQNGSTECGYYVMRYILDIVRSHYNSENLTKVLERSTPYYENEINEVRDIWAKYFIANAPV